LRSGPFTGPVRELQQKDLLTMNVTAACMQPTSSRRSRKFLMTVIAAAVLAQSSCAENKFMNLTGNSVGSLLSKLESAGFSSRSRIESVLTTSLIQTGNTGSFKFYEANKIRFGDLEIESVTYREPTSTGTPSARALLSLKIGPECTNRVEVLRQYGPLHLTQTPRGHSVNEETVYSHERPWGVLSFGFSAARPDCLRSITFTPK
jgi:hypothetical protein